MDIEGYEYEALLAMSMSLQSPFRITVVELHDLHYLFDSAFFRFASRAIEKLLVTHACVHIHPKNLRRPITIGRFAIPPMLEMTFLRRDRLGVAVPATVFPHPLDRDTTSRSPVILPSCFYEFRESSEENG